MFYKNRMNGTENKLYEAILFILWKVSVGNTAKLDLPP